MPFWQHKLAGWSLVWIKITLQGGPHEHDSGLNFWKSGIEVAWSRVRNTTVGPDQIDISKIGHLGIFSGPAIWYFCWSLTLNQRNHIWSCLLTVPCLNFLNIPCWKSLESVRVHKSKCCDLWLTCMLILCPKCLLQVTLSFQNFMVSLLHDKLFHANGSTFSYHINYGVHRTDSVWNYVK